MNDMTKQILIFVAGVIVGVLIATSTIFKGDPEPAPSASVSTNTSPQAPSQSDVQSAAPVAAQSGQSAPATSTPQVTANQPAVSAAPAAAEPESSAPAAPLDEPETELAMDDSSDSSDDPTASEAAETDEESGSDDQETVFCMESGGQCRYFDAQTMAQADLSAEECRQKLTEE